METERIGRMLCFVLRHKPSALGLKLDPMGFANVDHIIEALRQQGRTVTLEEILHCVETDNKNRFQYMEDRNVIRCVQGHSFPVSTSSYNPFTPTTKLYHGTSEGFLPYIKTEGITPQSRVLVHLTKDRDEAISVGKRYAKKGPVVLLEIDAVKMAEDGFNFYVAFNGVILVNHVPFEYVKEVE